VYVYILRSRKSVERVYVGCTSDLQRRLKEHNDGEADATYKHRPWYIDVAVWFHDKQRAIEFEKYLKTGSGRAFSKRHF
jgi:predicted GIY-YIG superfamily endonuclease